MQESRKTGTGLGGEDGEGARGAQGGGVSWDDGVEEADHRHELASVERVPDKHHPLSLQRLQHEGGIEAAPFLFILWASKRSMHLFVQSFVLYKIISKREVLTQWHRLQFRIPRLILTVLGNFFSMYSS